MVFGASGMKSSVAKRSIVIAGHKTSVSLEDGFWKALKEIAAGRDMTLSEIVAAIKTDRQHRNLSSAIRLFVLDYYQNRFRKLAQVCCRPRLVVRRGQKLHIRRHQVCEKSQHVLLK